MTIRVGRFTRNGIAVDAASALTERDEADCLVPSKIAPLSISVAMDIVFSTREKVEQRESAAVVTDEEDHEAEDGTCERAKLDETARPAAIAAYEGRGMAAEVTFFGVDDPEAEGRALLDKEG